MKTRFATPTERDLRFVRNSGAKPEEFAEEILITSSLIDGGIIIVLLITALAIYGVVTL